MTNCLFLEVIFKSILAGLSIGLGGLIFSIVNFTFNQYVNKSKYYVELGKIIASDLFSIGLWTVCQFKLMLFTGKIGLIFESIQGCSYYPNLLIMLIFNLSAAYGFGLAVYYLMKLFKDNSIVDRYKSFCLSIATGKYTNTNHLRVLFQAMFCGLCVYMAVKSFSLFNGSFKGVLILNYFVLCFVWSGFQHCIANTYYFGQVGSFNRDVSTNVAICIIGNWLGTFVVSLLHTYLINKPVVEESSSSSYSSDLPLDNKADKPKTCRRSILDRQISDSSDDATYSDI